MKKENKYIFAAVICALLATISSTRPARALSAGLLADLSTQTVTKKDSVVDLNDLIGENAVLPERVFSDSVAGGKPVEGISADSIITDTLNKVKKSRFVLDMVDLDNVVNFTAKDSLVIAGNNNAFMYGPSNVTYGDIDLKANEIHMNMDQNEVYAVGVPDSTGELQGNPVFEDKSGKYASKSMRYNFKSQKGLIKDVITEQGEGFLTGGITKMMNREEYFIKNGRYTTCDDHDEPHFYMNITKGKVKPK